MKRLIALAAVFALLPMVVAVWLLLRKRKESGEE